METHLWSTEFLVSSHQNMQTYKHTSITTSYFHSSLHIYIYHLTVKKWIKVLLYGMELQIIKKSGEDKQDKMLNQKPLKWEVKAGSWTLTTSVLKYMFTTNFGCDKTILLTLKKSPWRSMEWPESALS